MDNWFTSVPLAEELLKPPYKLTVVGTLRSNKREIPKEMANTRSRPVGATYHVVFEKELEKRTEPRQVREKRWIIGRSSSLSNMPKINSAAQRRCSSVPPTITVQYLLPSTTHNERAHSYNLLSDGPDSYDGDFSGTDSDVTYCPTDVEILSDSSSPDILEEPSTSGIMSGVFHGNIDEGRKRKSRSDPSQWKKNKNKKLRMSGKEYLGFTKPKSES
ncbi:unnamed protein product [Arctia plantaginis]|uniref:PiggyBac transposable element-derived protein domain-containing protein n=1 Tax=Arctia plantaginis TaxID=874455 RepID=A0A8S0ZAJ2_ARCPL|nr:unnamed protein product [Arctia plantaginis]